MSEVETKDINTEISEETVAGAVEEVKDIVSVTERPMNKRTMVITMVLSFVIPMVIAILAFYANQIYPGGTNTVLIYDLKAQFLSIYASLRYVFDSNSSLFYSFTGALGSNAFPNYSSYVLDPISWITVMFPLEKLPDALYYITIIKIGMCGLAFSVFILFGKKKYRYPFAIVMISCCYALTSYNIMYSQCLLWFNVVALLPITLLGIERILDGKRGTIFIISLSLSMVYVMQMAYMTGIFTALYLLYRLTEVDRDRLKILLKSFLYVLLSVGLYAPVGIPTVLSIVSGRLKLETDEIKAITYFPFWKIIRQIFSCQYDTIDTGGLPYIFCGTLTVILAVVFFFVSNKRRISKMAALLIIVLFFMSFYFGPLNRAWHGFVEPNSFPARYSYTFCCFMLILAYEAAVCIYRKAVIPIDSLRIICVFLALIVLGEQYLNSSYIIASNNVDRRYKLYAEYKSYIDQVGDVIGHIDRDAVFYRIGRGDSYYTMNDGMVFNYNGIGFFSSYYDRNLMNFLGTMGYSQSEHVLYDMGATPVLESILGVRYRLSRINGYPRYDEVYSHHPYVLYENKDALPLGFVFGSSDMITNGDLTYVDEANMGNAFVYQEIVLNEILGEQCDIYEGIKYEMSEVSDDDNGDNIARHIIVDFTAEDDKPIWVFCKAPSKEEYDAHKVDEDALLVEDTTVNGKVIEPIRTQLSTICVCLGEFEKGQKVRLDTLNSRYFGNPWLVYFDEEACSNALDKIRSRGVDIKECREGKIRGEVSVDEDGSYVMFTIPYMEGYRVKVDGELTEYTDYRSVLLLVPVDRGTHSIEISFIPPGLISGTVIGLVSLVILIAYHIVSKRKQHADTYIGLYNQFKEEVSGGQ